MAFRKKDTAWDTGIIFFFSFSFSLLDLGGLDIHLQYLSRRCAPFLFFCSPGTTRAIILPVFSVWATSTLRDVSLRAYFSSSSTPFPFLYFPLFPFNSGLCMCICVYSFYFIVCLFIPTRNKIPMKTPCLHHCMALTTSIYLFLLPYPFFFYFAASNTGYLSICCRYDFYYPYCGRLLSLNSVCERYGACQRVWSIMEERAKREKRESTGSSYIASLDLLTREELK